jgi:hypothetical protein
MEQQNIAVKVDTTEPGLPCSAALGGLFVVVAR